MKKNKQIKRKLKDRYVKITKSKWFKTAYLNKSVGETLKIE